MTARAETVEYAVFDADNHYYEPYDCFSRHLEDRFRDRTVDIVTGEDGLHRMFVAGKPASMIPALPCDSVPPPGSFRGMVSDMDLHPTSNIQPIQDWPAYMNREARLKLMDEQGVGSVLMFPSSAVTVEYDLYQLGAEAAFANIRSFNRWVEEEWGYDDRIFSVPMLSLFDVELAVVELERVLSQGARFVHLNPGPAYGRSPADPHFDPFWARVEDAGAPVVFHVGDNRYNRIFTSQWGQAPDNNLFSHTPLQTFMGLIDRPITDTLASLILGDLFTRFPKLKIMSVENGCRWVGPLLVDMDHAARMTQSRGLAGIPSEIFREHVYVAPFWEDDVTELASLIGVDHVLFGSDFPHPEGEVSPIDFLHRLTGMNALEIRQIMQKNMTVLSGA